MVDLSAIQSITLMYLMLYFYVLQKSKDIRNKSFMKKSIS